ncbi:MAG: hypothetical protein ACOYO1_13365 [Bacteroidales bacterium]
METNKDWSNLPSHKPNVDLWERIETELDLESISSHLDRLPAHSPDLGLWNSINSKLAYFQNIRYLYFAGIGVSAIILLLVFTYIFSKDNKTIENKKEISITQTEKVTNPLPSNSKNHSDYNNTNIPLKTNEKVKSNFKTNDFKNKLSKNENAYFETENKIQKGSSEQKSNNLSLNVPIKELISQRNKLPITLFNTIETNQPLLVFNQKESNNRTEADKNINIEIEKQNNNEKPLETLASFVIKTDSTLSVGEKENIKSPESNINRIQPKSTDKAISKGLYTVGLDFTFNKIMNADKFSYAANKYMNQYGINFKYNYLNYFIQTGCNFSKFSDYLKNNSDQKLNQYKTFDYVDSVLYNSQGAIIQYVTHTVTLNDSLLFQQMLDVTKKYALINIPLMLGYEYCYGKFSFSLKAGIIYSLIISEKETIFKPQDPNISILKIYTEKSTIHKTNWAAILSAELDYNFSRKWGLSFEPVIQYYFKPLYPEMDKNSSSNNQTPYLLGVKTGLFYKF